MTAAQPSETTVGNMIRRVLKIIREEYARWGPVTALRQFVNKHSMTSDLDLLHIRVTQV